MFTTFVFFMSLFIIFYLYIGYPLLVYLLGRFLCRQVNKKDHFPHVTIMIPAFNEADNIEKTLKNKLALDYPREKPEIIVISDGSTDGTDNIVKEYECEGVKLIRQEPRAGKTAALNLAEARCDGEIIVFSDANSIYDSDALKKIMANFADSNVGYVTGKMVYSNPGQSVTGDGCTFYMQYENFLRTHETRIGSIVGVDGGIDAVRKSLYRRMKADQLPDLVLPLSVIEQGYRAVYEPEALLEEDALGDAGDEYRMRVRVALRAFWALSDMRHLLAPHRYGLYSIQLWSHKVLRYFGFLFLIAAWIANLFLLSKGLFYVVCFIVQNAAYFAAIASSFLEHRHTRIKILYYCQYFALLNLSAAHAFSKFILREKKVTWTPRKG